MEGKDFQRGKVQGRQDERLDNHSEHLDKINGSIGDAAQALAELASEVRSLKEATIRRQDQILQRQSLLGRTVGLGILILALLAYLHPLH